MHIAVERSVENQARQEHRGLQRITDDIGKCTASFESLFLNEEFRSIGMYEDGNAQLLGLGPERIKARRGGYRAVDMATYGCTAMPKFRNGVFELLGGQFRMLQ